MQLTGKTYFYWLSVIIPLLLVCIFAYINRNYQLDDALIYLRYIRNFHEGHGLVYNPGDRFNGLTSPLFSYIILVVTFFFKNYQLVNILTSSFFMFLMVLVASRLFSKNDKEILLTSIILSLSMFFYTTLGMESTLFLFLISLTLYLYQKDSDYFFVVLAFLGHTRSEGIFLAIPLVAMYLFHKRKLPEWKIISISLVVFIIPILINYFYYSHILPMTGSAKMGQGKSGLWGDGIVFYDIRYLFKSFFGGRRKFILFSTIPLISVYILRKHKLFWPSIIFFISLFAFYSILNVPSYHWYFTPFMLFMLLFFSKTVYSGVEHFIQRKQYYLAIPLLCFAIYIFHRGVRFKEEHSNVPYRVVGTWLYEHTEPGSSVAMVDIGTVGWYSKREVVDILGLVNRHNADFIGERKLNSWLTKYQPDYFLIHKPAWPHEEAHKLLLEKDFYEKVEVFDIENFELLKKRLGIENKEIISAAKEADNID